LDTTDSSKRNTPTSTIRDIPQKIIKYFILMCFSVQLF
jgi:hypothetical protein